MLKEEQAAELLRRCESIAGRALKQTRGNLRRAETRAAAVWELVVSEAVAQLGRVELEPPGVGQISGWNCRRAGGCLSK